MTEHQRGRYVYLRQRVHELDGQRDRAYIAMWCFLLLALAAPLAFYLWDVADGSWEHFALALVEAAIFLCVWVTLRIAENNTYNMRLVRKQLNELKEIQRESTEVGTISSPDGTAELGLYPGLQGMDDSALSGWFGAEDDDLPGRGYPSAS